MKKYNTPVLSSLAFMLLLSGCATTTTVDSSTNNTVGISQDVISEAETKAQEDNQDFVEENAGLPPEEIIELRYEKAVTVSGPPNEYFELYNADGKPNWEHAYYIAQHLQVDYSKTAYIQYNGGTYGLESTLAAMDKKVPGVAETLKDFQEYHTITDIDSEYWKQQLAAADTPQAKAELLVSTLGQQYRKFYGEPTDAYSIQNGTVTAVSSLTGLSRDDLGAIMQGRGYLSDIIEVLPNDWPYKSAVLELL